MMKLVLLSLVCMSAVHSSSKLAKKIHRDITKFNNDAACWGKGNALKFRLALIHSAEQCSNSPSQDLLKPVNPFLAVLTPTNNPFQTLPAPANNPFQTLPAPSNNPFQTLPASTSQVQRLPQATQQGFNLHKWNQLWSTVFVQPNSRTKREATQGLLETDEEDFQEFLEDLADFKSDMTTKLSNLTCVLSKLKMLDSNLQVNLKAWTHDLWSEIDLSETLAGSDPEWRNMINTGYTDCYSLAQSWPQETLDRSPLTKVFGRHMVFFKCAQKVEAKCCMEAQADDWLTTMYGQDPTVDYSQFGLPSNKYQRAALAIKVMTEAATDEEEFVGDFFYNDSHM